MSLPFTQNIGNIPLTGAIGITSATDIYPTHIDSLGMGGYQTYDTVANRNTITALRRQFGMLVSVCNDPTPANNQVYMLANVALGGTNNTLTDNANWIPFAGGGGGGVTSFNTLTGAVVLAAGSGITLTPAGNTITIASTGGGWGLLGNSGTVDGTNFIGNTDNVPLSFRVNNTIAGRLDATKQNAFFGPGAGASNSVGINNSYFGGGAGGNATGSNNVAIGQSSGYTLTNGYECTLLGSATTVGSAGANGAIALGYGSVADSNELVAGSPQEYISNLYFGSGKTAGSNMFGQSFSIHGSGGNGTDQAGGSINMLGGKGTGTAYGGELRFFTSDASAISSSTPQGVSENMVMTPINKDVCLFGRLKMTEGNNVTAGNNITLGNGNFFTVNGNTQINTIITTNWSSSGPNAGGAMIILLFTGTPTIKHNTAGTGAPLLLNGSVDISATNNFILGLIYDAANGVWQECFRKHA